MIELFPYLDRKISFFKKLLTNFYMPIIFICVGAIIEGSAHPARGFQYLIYLLVSVCIAICYLLPGYCLISQFNSFKSITAKIALGCALMTAIYAVVYLLAIRIFFNYHSLVNLLFLFAVLLFSFSFASQNFKQLNKELKPFFKTNGLIPCLVFWIALSIPHLDQKVRYDVLAPSATETRASNYQPDSRIPFHIIQILNNGLNHDIYNLFGGWPIRAPLLGLNTGFFITLLNLEVPQKQSQARFEFFDKDNYWVHRIVGTFLNSLVLLAPILLAETIGVSSEIAQFTQLFMSFGVFTIINIYFIWPKFFATFLLILFLYLVKVEKRAVFSGITLSLAYLAHSFIILYVPGFILYLFMEKSRFQWKFFFISFLFCSTPWLLFCHFYNPQTVFYSYPFLTHPNNSIFWFRVQSFFNTLFPFGLSYSPYSSFSIGDIAEGTKKGFDLIPAAGMSSAWLFYQSYQNTLAGALGLAFFPIAYYSIVRLWDTYKSAILGLFIVPLVTIILYWGFSCYGVMKECGQPLLLLPLLLGCTLLFSRAYWKIAMLISATIGLAVVFLTINFEIHFETFNAAVFCSVVVAYLLALRSQSLWHKLS